MGLPQSKMNKEKRKNIFSWIALTSGIVSFLYMAYGTLCILYIVSDNWMLPIWLLLLISIIAIFSGGYGLIGKVNRGIRTRSLAGVILALLFWVAFWIWCAYLIEW
jgi:cation transport ATPase